MYQLLPCTYANFCTHSELCTHPILYFFTISSFQSTGLPFDPLSLERQLQFLKVFSSKPFLRDLLPVQEAFGTFLGMYSFRIQPTYSRSYPPDPRFVLKILSDPCFVLKIRCPHLYPKSKNKSNKNPKIQKQIQ